MEIMNEADEKFKDRQGELCEMLFGMLREINALEREFVAYGNAEIRKIPALAEELLADDSPDKGIMEVQEPDEKHGFGDLRERYGEIVKDRCTERLLAKPYGQSFYSKITYAFADADFEGGTLFFKMKSPKRADIEVRYKHGTQDCGNRFVLVNQNGRWLVDAHNWMTDYDHIWHRGHI